MKNIKLTGLFCCLFTFLGLSFAATVQAAPKEPLAACTEQWHLTINATTGSYTQWACLGQDGNKATFRYQEFDKPSGHTCDGVAEVTKIGSDRLSASSNATCSGGAKEICSWTGTVVDNSVFGAYECGGAYFEFTGTRSGGAFPFFPNGNSHHKKK